MIKHDYKNLLFISLVFLIIGIFLAVILLSLHKPSAAADKPNVVINNKVIGVEIAGTPAKQWQGLSDRKFLAKNKGMLFVFSSLESRTFVMRRMNFSLDIIWIKDNKILKIDKNLPPEGENDLKRYNSNYKVNYALEVNGGFTDKNGIKSGDKIKISDLSK